MGKEPETVCEKISTAGQPEKVICKVPAKKQGSDSQHKATAADVNTELNKAMARFFSNQTQPKQMTVDDLKQWISSLNPSEVKNIDYFSLLHFLPSDKFEPNDLKTRYNAVKQIWTQKRDSVAKNVNDKQLYRDIIKRVDDAYNVLKTVEGQVLYASTYEEDILTHPKVIPKESVSAPWVSKMWESVWNFVPGMKHVGYSSDTESKHQFGFLARLLGRLLSLSTNPILLFGVMMLFVIIFSVQFPKTQTKLIQRFPLRKPYLRKARFNFEATLMKSDYDNLRDITTRREIDEDEQAELFRAIDEREQEILEEYPDNNTPILFDWIMSYMVMVLVIAIIRDKIIGIYSDIDDLSLPNANETNSNLYTTYQKTTPFCQWVLGMYLAYEHKHLKAKAAALQIDLKEVTREFSNQIATIALALVTVFTPFLFTQWHAPTMIFRILWYVCLRVVVFVRNTVLPYSGDDEYDKYTKKGRSSSSSPSPITTQSPSPLGRILGRSGNQVQPRAVQKFAENVLQNNFPQFGGHQGYIDYNHLPPNVLLQGMNLNNTSMSSSPIKQMNPLAAFKQFTQQAILPNKPQDPFANAVRHATHKEKERTPRHDRHDRPSKSPKSPKSPKSLRSHRHKHRTDKGGGGGGGGGGDRERDRERDRNRDNKDRRDGREKSSRSNKRSEYRSKRHRPYPPQKHRQQYY